MNTSQRILQVILIFILISLLAGCRVSKSPDYWPTEGWRTTTPEEQGMDSEMLSKMVEHIMEQKYDIHSVTVIRNGYMVADVYFYPYKSDTMHQLWSCTKSITSTLIGIAVNQGYIDDVHQPVLSFFPERSTDNLDQNKENMTLEHLLTMSSGLDCSGNSYLHQMEETDDWVQFMLDLPMAEPPGTRFEYCNGASFLLSAIIQEVTGMTALDYAEEQLFGPLGINDVFWPSSPHGINIGYAELRMKPHDMAKIGFLYLNEGRWADTQIISEDWVEASSRAQISTAYGYQWWIGINGIYSAQGALGQFIFVVPDYNLIVVFTGNLSINESNTTGLLPPELMLDLIIAAAQSSTPLPPSPDGVEFLNAKIKQASQQREEPQPIPPLPEIAQIVSGQIYIMDNKPGGVESVTLTFPGEAEAVLKTVMSESRAYIENPQENRTNIIQPVGLDNVYRFSPGDFGIPMGMKGWWESDGSFIILADYIGNTGRNRFQFIFEGEQISIEITTVGWIPGEKTIINGWMKE